jgi:hypothetical protein
VFVTSHAAPLATGWNDQLPDGDFHPTEETHLGTAHRKSGKFVLRLPHSLHAALAREAEDEGVSLNQLAVSKLSIPLSKLVRQKSRSA